MALLFLKKIGAVMLLALIIIASDFAVVYGVNAKVSEALNNAVDAAIIENLDNAALTYQGMDEILKELVRQKFIRVMEEELGAGYSPAKNAFYNNVFYRHGIKLNEFRTDWYGEFPKVYASVSVKVDTALLGKLMPGRAEVKINNFDSLYWQWAYLQ